jgi:hypothetical protein
MAFTREELIKDAQAAKDAGDDALEMAIYQELEKLDTQPTELSWSQVPGQAWDNLGSSAKALGNGVLESIKHPINTADALLDVADGALQNALPDRLTSYLHQNGLAETDTQATANAVGQFMKDRYGSSEGLKQTLANDPVGAMADLSTVMTGGAALAGKIPQLSRVASKVGAVGNAINPINLPISLGKGITKTASPLTTKISNAANVLIPEYLGHTTGAGAESIRAAYRAGQQVTPEFKQRLKDSNHTGSETYFKDHITGNVPFDDIVDEAKYGLSELKDSRGSLYKAGMYRLSKDNTVLNFNKIDNVVSDSLKISDFKGQNINAGTKKIQDRITKAVDDWKNLDPSQYHTAHGLDALKQKINNLNPNPVPGSPAELVLTKVSNAIKDEIINQSPDYAKVMKQYADDSKEIDDVTKTFSLGRKGTVDSAIRKLQSVTRNNVNTNFGKRLELAKLLEDKGESLGLIESIAGQNLNNWVPRNVQGSPASLLGALGAIPSMGLSLAPFSPRLMGNAAYFLGKRSVNPSKASSLLGKLPDNTIPSLLNTGAIINRKDERN